MSGTYKPTGTTPPPRHLLSILTGVTANIFLEHGGLKEDGTPDKRVGTGEFAQGKVDPVEAGKQGGHSSGGSSEDSGDSGSSGKGRELQHYLSSP